MQPQPLLGIFAHPAFDHRGHRLHGAGDVDIAGGVARRLHFFADLAPKAVAVGIAHDAKPTDRRAGLPGQERDQRIGEAAAAEERHLDAAGIMLVGQHADGDAGLQQAGEPHRRIQRGRDQFAHQRRAQFDDQIADRRDARAPEQHGGLDAELGRADGGDFPVGEMGAETDRRLAALPDALEALGGLRRVGDDVARRRLETGDGKIVEMGELDHDAAEIVPHPAEDCFDLGGGFFRVGGAQILAAKPVLLEQRPNFARQGAGEIRRAAAIHPVHRAQQGDRERTEGRIEHGLQAGTS